MRLIPHWLKKWCLRHAGSTARSTDTGNVTRAVEPLEARKFLSASPAILPPAGVDAAVPALHAAPSAAPKAATVTNYLIGFYGYTFGGATGSGFGNQWITSIVNAAKKATGAVTQLLPEETGGPTALKNLLASLDRNKDHVIQASETANAAIRVLGYSLGGIEAANFTRTLNQPGAKVQGYKLAVAVPIRVLVTIDPVNYPFDNDALGLKHTDGPGSNVQKFINYYQNGRTNGQSSIALTEHTTGFSLGDAPISEPTFPVVGYLHGGPLASKALVTKQYAVDSGVFATTVVKQRFQSGVDGELEGRFNNHSTMPFFLYSYAVKMLKS